MHSVTQHHLWVVRAHSTQLKGGLVQSLGIRTYPAQKYTT